MRKILKTFWFNGRINRFEYTVSAVIIFSLLLVISNKYEVPPDLLVLSIVYVYYAQGAKRCQDRGINGFFILNPANFIFNFTEKSDAQINKFGEADNLYLQKLLLLLRNVKLYLKKIYRISLSPQKQEKILWKDLKKYHANATWHSGIFEKEKYIHTSFEISEYIIRDYYYMLYDDCFSCSVRIIEDFPQELTTDLFVLATHFNNLLEKGTVIINVKQNCIEYNLNNNQLIPLLNTDEIDNQLLIHYKTSKEIYWAFQKMIDENEAPAIIIADLIKMINSDKESEA